MRGAAGQQRGLGRDARVLALVALLAAMLFAGLVWSMRQSGAEPAVQQAQSAPRPAAQADWKSKGTPGASVIVEEWGDFQ